MLAPATGQLVAESVLNGDSTARTFSALLLLPWA